MIDCHVEGYDDGIVAENTEHFKAARNTVRGRDTIELPQDLVNATIEAISAHQKTTGQRPTETDAESAAEHSGLKQWLTDKSVDVASLGTSLLALYLGK